VSRKKKNQLGMVEHVCNPTQRQEYQEFKAGPGKVSKTNSKTKIQTKRLGI
jgi:hypothetical protein